MSDVTITERQQYWLDHIRAAAAFDGNLAEYARSAGLKPKELYSWKGILRSRGLLVQPLVNLLRDRLLAYDIVCMDETRLQVLKEPGKRAESQSYLWVQRGGPPDPPIVLYDYDPSRSQRVPILLLEGFSGYLVTDGYEGHGKVCVEYGLTAVGCSGSGRAQGLTGRRCDGQDPAVLPHRAGDQIPLGRRATAHPPGTGRSIAGRIPCLAR